MTDPRSPSWRRRFRRYAVLGVGLYAVWLGLLYYKQDSMVFPRQYSGPAMKEGRLPPRMESMWINAGTEERPIRVEAWYLPPEAGDGPVAVPAAFRAQDPSPTPDTAGVANSRPVEPGGRHSGIRHPAVIYCHGNAELIDDNELRAREYAARGFAVLLPEYRGYGRSQGSPSQSAITEDLVRFYDMLVARPDIDPARIYIHGRSLGGGVAAQIAARRPTAGLILESTFTSISCFAWGVGGIPWVCKHPFRTDAALREYRGPVLIFHGVDDNIIPISHGRALHGLLPHATYIETAGDHINYPPDHVAFWREIDRFLGVAALSKNR
jgi:uncharacterized protein